MKTVIAHCVACRVWGACVLCLSAAAGAGAETPMRYDFDAGERLVYERRVRVMPLDGDQVVQRYREQIQFWILGSDLDEDYVLAELIREEDGHAVERRDALFYVDHLGQRRFSDEMSTRLDGSDPIFEMLPALPPALESDAHWLGAPDHLGRRYRCERERDAAEKLEQVRYTIEDSSGVDELAGRTTRGVYWFDPYARVVTRVETETTDPRNRRRVQAVSLLHKRYVETDFWLRQRIEERQKYLSALRREDHLLNEIAARPADVDVCILEINRVWTELAAEFAERADSPFRRIAAERRMRSAAAEPLYRERAEQAAAWLYSRAADWSLQTPDGRTLRSETLRDRLVVEYFWSANSEPGLHGFDFLRALATRLPADGFRIVCLNIDADVVEAKRAIELCGGKLTHVLAGPPVGAKPPRELPIFRVLDPEGSVLAVYFGVGPRLAEKIAALVR